MSENLFFHEVKRDGITSLHGIDVKFNKAKTALDGKSAAFERIS